MNTCVSGFSDCESFGRVLYTGLAGLRTEEEDQDRA